HNPQHRGGAPYADRRTANKYASRSGVQPGAGINRSFSGGGADVNAVAIRQSGVSGDRIGNRGPSPGYDSNANAIGSAGLSGNWVRASSNRGNNSFAGASAGNFNAGRGRGGAVQGGGGIRGGGGRRR